MKRFCKYGLFFVGIFVLCLVVSLLFRKSDDVQEESTPDYPYTNLETDERISFPPMETGCILEEEISPIASSLEGDSLLVKVKSSDKGLYMVFLEDGTVQKLDGPNVNFALLHDGIVYYNGNGIRSYDLKDGSVKNLSKEGYQDRGGSYAGVAFYDHSLVLRCEFYYEIYLFDIESGEIECIISQE